MSDVGVFPAGAFVWFMSLAWCCICAFTLLVFLLVAWLRTRKQSGGFTSDRFCSCAIGALTSGIVAGLSMWLINRSGSLGAFAHWIDRPVVGMVWLAITVALGPLVALTWAGRAGFHHS